MPRKIKRSPLDKLMKHWERASPQERRQFLTRIAAEDGMPLAAAAPETDLPIANGRYLLPATVDRIETIMRRRKLNPHDIVREAGFAGQGMALTRALVRRSSLRLSIIAALQDWLRAQEQLLAEERHDQPRAEPEERP